MKSSFGQIIKQIRTKKERLEDLKGKNFLSKALKDFFHTEIIYASSDVGGKRLSHKQAREIVSRYPKFSKVSTKNKTILQAKGQKIALEWIENFSKQRGLIDIYVIRKLHKMILQEAWPEIAGSYRQEDLKIKNSSLQLPPYIKIPEEMYLLDQYLQENQKSLGSNDILSIIEFLTNVRHKLAWIHPFRDANGRVARFSLNLIARRYGLPYLLTPTTKVSNRAWGAIQEADNGNLTALTKLHLDLLSQSFDVILNYWQHGKLTAGRL